jgi:hypothetical protein
MNAAADEKVVADAMAKGGATPKVASQAVVELSPALVAGAKMVAISGSSTPRTKHRFYGSWKPRYIVRHCICPSFPFVYFASLGFFALQCVSLQ